MGKFLYLIVYQGDVRGIYSDVAAYASHGDSHVCSFQGRFPPAFMKVHRKYLT